MKKRLLLIGSLAGMLTLGSAQALNYEEVMNMDRSERQAYFQGLTSDERDAQKAELGGQERPQYNSDYRSNYEAGQSRPQYNSDYRSNYESGQSRPSRNSDYRSNYESGQSRPQGSGRGRPW